MLSVPAMFRYIPFPALVVVGEVNNGVCVWELKTLNHGKKQCTQLKEKKTLCI